MDFSPRMFKTRPEMVGRPQSSVDAAQDGDSIFIGYASEITHRCSKVHTRQNDAACQMLEKIMSEFFVCFPEDKPSRELRIQSGHKETPWEYFDYVVHTIPKSDLIEKMASVLRKIAVKEIHSNNGQYVFPDRETLNTMAKSGVDIGQLAYFALNQALGISAHISVVEPGKPGPLLLENGEGNGFKIELQQEGPFYQSVNGSAFRGKKTFPLASESYDWSAKEAENMSSERAQLENYHRACNHLRMMMLDTDVLVTLYIRSVSGETSNGVNHVEKGNEGSMEALSRKYHGKSLHQSIDQSGDSYLRGNLINGVAAAHVENDFDYNHALDDVLENQSHVGFGARF